MHRVLGRVCKVPNKCVLEAGVEGGEDVRLGSGVCLLRHAGECGYPFVRICGLPMLARCGSRRDMGIEAR